MTVVALTGRPMSALNRCVIELSVASLPYCDYALSVVKGCLSYDCVRSPPPLTLYYSNIAQKFCSYTKSVKKSYTKLLKVVLTTMMTKSMAFCQLILVIQTLRIVFCTDVTRWPWDQRQDGEQHFCFLLGFTPVNREGRPGVHFP